MRDVILNEIKKDLIISKSDFKEYFNSKKVITKQEYVNYIRAKRKKK